MSKQEFKEKEFDNEIEEEDDSYKEEEQTILGRASRFLRGMLKPSVILRRTKIKQVCGSWGYNNYDGGLRACALGTMLHEYYGWAGDDVNDTREFIRCRDKLYEDFPEIANLATEIMEKNDNDYESFGQIADWLEKKGL